MTTPTPQQLISQMIEVRRASGIDECLAEVPVLRLALKEIAKARPACLAEEDAVKELGLLYNHSEDDSRQFTRWNMIVAIQHGYRIAQAGEAEGGDATTGSVHEHAVGSEADDAPNLQGQQQ